MKKIAAFFIFVILSGLIVISGCSKKNEASPEPGQPAITKTPTSTGTITNTPTTTQTPTETATPTITVTPHVISFRQDVSLYTGCADAHISEQNSNNNYGAIDMLQAGKVGSNGVMRGLIKFDISSIPGGAIITSAKLYITLNNASGAVFNLKLQPIGTVWNEDFCTWNNATTGMPWTPGGDISSANAAMPVSIDPGAVANPYVFEVDVSVVQGWLNTPSNNMGLAFKTADEFVNNFVTICSSEDSTPANRPQLIIEYH